MEGIYHATTLGSNQHEIETRGRRGQQTLGALDRRRTVEDHAQAHRPGGQNPEAIWSSRKKNLTDRLTITHLSERCSMTHKSKSENNPVNHRQVYSVLAQLSEPELLRLLKSVKALRKELKLILPSDDEVNEAVIAPQNLLKIWSDELERIVTVKQAKEINRRLHNWDNEGGAVDHAPKQHSLSGIASSNRVKI